MATLGADQSVVRVDGGLHAVPGVERARLARGRVEVADLALALAEEVLGVVVALAALVRSDAVAVEGQAVAVAEVLADR